MMNVKKSKISFFSKIIDYVMYPKDSIVNLGENSNKVFCIQYT